MPSVLPQQTDFGAGTIDMGCHANKFHKSSAYEVNFKSRQKIHSKKRVQLHILHLTRRRASSRTWFFLANTTSAALSNAYRDSGFSKRQYSGCKFTTASYCRLDTEKGRRIDCMIDQKTTFVTDTVHGSVPLSPCEKKLISTEVYNRLHNVLQNSVVYLTYPSNRTSRFIHSLGCSQNR